MVSVKLSFGLPAQALAEGKLIAAPDPQVAGKGHGSVQAALALWKKAWWPERRSSYWTEEEGNPASSSL